MDSQTRALLVSSPGRQMAQLLTRDLERMRPSSLRHEYLTSAANAINHPEVRSRDEEGNTYLIGFGDKERTLPLVAIAGADGKFFHCMVPRYDHPIERKLVDKLQERDDDWADEHDTARRPLRQQIREASRGGRAAVARISREGVNKYSPAPRLTPEEMRRNSATWYDTDRFDESQAGFEHEWRVDLNEDEDSYSIHQNLSRSASMVSGGKQVRVRLEPEAASYNKMVVSGVREKLVPRQEMDRVIAGQLAAEKARSDRRARIESTAQEVQAQLPPSASTAPHGPGHEIGA